MKNLIQLLCLREIGIKSDKNISIFCEQRCASDVYQETKCSVPNTVRSTFVIAFSPSGDCLASAHANHRIYLFDVMTGRKLKTLVGHTRSPWTLEWHPNNSQLLASGCLAGEVRIWFISNLLNCYQTVYSVDTYNVMNCVASLAFHKIERVLVIASSNEVHYWDWAQEKPVIILKTNTDKEKIRLVKWSDSKLITGISNNSQNHSSDSYDRKHSLLSRIVGIYRNTIDDNNIGLSDSRLQTIVESINQQLVTNDVTLSANQNNDFISSSLLTLQSLLQSTQSNLPNISQIKTRITQIVEKLLSLTNSSDENQIRRKISESLNDNTLSHCLWLTQKGIQLSRTLQMTSAPHSSHSAYSIPRVIIDSVPSNTEPLIGFRPRSPPLNEMISMPSNSRSVQWYPHYISALPQITHKPSVDFRLQCWSNNEIPNISDSKANIVAAKVRILNDASVDISRDGELLVCLVPNSVNCINLTLYSLSHTSFGVQLCQWSFGSNAISVSLSPTSKYIVVGLSCLYGSQGLHLIITYDKTLRLLHLVIESNVKQKDTIAQIFRRKDDMLEHVRNVEILRSDSITSVNSIRFMPNCGQGLVYGTNKGELVIARPNGEKCYSEETKINKL